MQKITPFLWFDHQAEEAAHFYASIFKNSKVTGISHYGEGSPMPAGTVMTVSFQLDGQEFTALNGGPMFAFTEAISLYVNCETQAEVDKYWDKLSDGGKPGQCGWITDRFGVTWQIVPAGLGDLIAGPDPVRAQRALQAMLKMGKLDIGLLKQAYEGK
jgi:predicted 3-demethylubiquinone-9 3-methyltransferase (glyoxalase superfamily)